MTPSDPRRIQSKIHSLEEEVNTLRARMTDQDVLREQLIQAQKMESLANLAAGVAHDFNNILQSILSYAQLARMGKKPEDPDFKTFLRIEEITNKGSDLSRQFLTIGRKVKTTPRPLDLNAKVKEIKSLLRRTIPKIIDIDLELHEGLKNISADEGQVEQVLMNLGINARDAMPDGGRLLFKTENVSPGEDLPRFILEANHDDYVLLSVLDTGVGISEETRRRIFEPFFTTKGGRNGTGLGLSIVYAIVKNHGGFIDCSSRVGEGTLFQILFPVMDGEFCQEQHDTPTCNESAGVGTEGILLVDDEPSILSSLNEILGIYGYGVTTAKNGEEAISRYNTCPADLVILDMDMPGMDGLQTLKALLSLDRNARVLISSGYSMNSRIKEALDLGAKGFLVKPYEVQELLDMVRLVADGRSSQDVGTSP